MARGQVASQARTGLSCMEIANIIQALHFGLPGLALTLGPIPFLYMTNRRAPHGELFVFLGPGLLACSLFVLACVGSEWTVSNDSQSFATIYQILLAFCATLMFPAILLLRRRWVGLLHVATLAGIAWLWLVGVMTLSHDWI